VDPRTGRLTPIGVVQIPGNSTAGLASWLDGGPLWVTRGARRAPRPGSERASFASAQPRSSEARGQHRLNRCARPRACSDRVESCAAGVNTQSRSVGQVDGCVSARRAASDERVRGPTEGGSLDFVAPSVSRHVAGVVWACAVAARPCRHE
jgi:hypothetical protein